VGLLGFVEPITSQWLSEMVSHALRPEIGAVGAKLYDQAGAIAHAGIVLDTARVATQPYRGVRGSRARRMSRLWAIQNYSAVAGACLVARRKLLDHVGGVDATNLPSAYFDVDLCLRLSDAGYRTVWTPYAELRWLDVAELPTLAREQRYMISRWGTVLQGDPNHNPNLGLEREDNGLAVQPRLSVSWSARR
jgi:GT2 family glycosyltransferase